MNSFQSGTILMLWGFIYQIRLGNGFCRQVLKGAKFYLFKKTLGTIDWASKHFISLACLEVSEKNNIGSGLNLLPGLDMFF